MTPVLPSRLLVTQAMRPADWEHVVVIMDELTIIIHDCPLQSGADLHLTADITGGLVWNITIAPEADEGAVTKPHSVALWALACNAVLRVHNRKSEDTVVQPRNDHPITTPVLTMPFLM